VPAALRVLFVVALVVATVVTIGRGHPGGLAQETGQATPEATPDATLPVIPPEVTTDGSGWPIANGDYAATRNAVNSQIDSSNVANLEVVWRSPIDVASSFGAATAPPVIVDGVIYYQDMASNVQAIDLATGQVKWTATYNVGNVGPNGLAVGYGLVFGANGDTAEVWALDAATGAEVWKIKLSYNAREGIDVAPVVYDGVLYVSTVPGNSQTFYAGGARGIFYAIDALTGDVLWQFDTTTDNLWGNPRINSGGGVWYTPTIDEEGNIYFGTGNAAPWPGTEEFPNASSRPGDNDYASSMVSLDGETGQVRWYVNAKPHDLFDLDFQISPVLITLNVNGEDRLVAIGAGKTGEVIAVDAETGEIYWRVAVGTHQNDQLQEIPVGSTVEVYPGALGGVEVPMAYADGVLFVPVVNLPTSYTSTELDATTFDLTAGTGQLVALDAATGNVIWQIELPGPAFVAATVSNDLVFTGGLDGILRAFNVADGSEVWSYQFAAGLNAPPSIVGDMLIVPAGGALVPREGQFPNGAPAPTSELVAFQLGDGVSDVPDPASTPAPVEAATPEGEDVGEMPELPTEVTVESYDILFQPKEVTIPANTDVTFTLPNLGVAPHNFSIDEAGISVDLAPGATETAVVNLPPGTYTYYCNVPGHLEAGMAGTLTVQ
jgi:glucose dehydrogenase/plastocyanin